MLLAFLLLGTSVYADDLMEKHKERTEKLKQKALEEATGVKISTPGTTAAFRSVINNVGAPLQEELGNGLFTWSFGGLKLSTFVNFDMTIDNPCRKMIQTHYGKTYRFIRTDAGPEFTYLAYKPGYVKGTEEPDPPPGDSDPAAQDPGELVSTGGGKYNTYDPAGMGIMDGIDGRQQMPAYITADRIRYVFRVEIVCKGGPQDGVVLKRYYWFYELTLPYKDGVPLTGSATSSAKLISSKDYANANALFGKDH